MDDTTQGNSERKKTMGRYTGGCHCGAVRFAVQADPSAGASRCNCSICSKVAMTGVNLKPDAFELLSDPAALSQYAWGPVATRYFCKTCGVHCFGKGNLPQLGGEFVSVNFNTLDEVDVNDHPIVYWDGRHNNWQAGPRSEPWPIFSPV